MVLVKAPLKAAPRSLAEAAAVAAVDAADAELVIQDLRDHLDPTAKTELMAQLAMPAMLAMMARVETMEATLEAAQMHALPLPLALPAALDPREHPDPLDPLEMMPLVVEAAHPALLDLLDQQVPMADPDRKDQPALLEKSLNQLEPQVPTALLVLQALLDPMEHLAQQATLAPQAQLAQLATLEPVPHQARMVHLAPRDQQVHQVEVAAATTAHHHALLLAIKPHHPATRILMMFMIS